MDMPAVSLLSVTPIYVAVLGLIFIPYTLRVGFFRLKSEIFLGDGGNDEMLRRIRGQANFVETVPLALLLLLVMELSGAGSSWLHALGSLLVFGRITHYLGLTGLGPKTLRPIGMSSTLLVYLVSSGWLLYQLL